MSKIELLKTLLKEAVQLCYEKDYSLINRRGRGGKMERAAAARVFYYMQRKLDDDDVRFSQFEGHHLDCEYNRNDDAETGQSGSKTNSNGQKMQPDMILHHRESNRKNTLVVEFKALNALNNDIEKDKRKLKAFTRQNGRYKYFLGVLVRLNRDDPNYTYFQEGAEKEEGELVDEPAD